MVAQQARCGICKLLGGEVEGKSLYINTCNLISSCVSVHTGAPVYIEKYAVSRVVGEKKNRMGENICCLCLAHTGQGVAAAFRSQSVAACGFRIQTPDGPAFLHSM
jgi:hypothetical protein